VLTGTEDRNITVAPQPGEHVTILGGIRAAGGWVIIRDLEISGGSSDRVSEEATPYPSDAVQTVGFQVSGSSVKIVNNVIHDNSAGINAAAEAQDTELYGNLVYYNGWSALGRAHGHGLSLQNLDGKKKVIDNLIFYQFGPGIQIYGSNTASLDNFEIAGNIIFNNGALNNEHSRNILIGGGKVARSPELIENYMYFTPSETLGGDHNIGYYPFGSGCADLRFEKNYIASDGAALTLFKCSIDSLKGNTLYGEIKGFKDEEYPKNRYFTRSSPPKGVEIFVRRNAYETKRANVVVFNWDRRKSVSFDGRLAGLERGDTYEVRNAQNYYGDVVTGRFDGRKIEISMVRATVAPPLGAAAPKTTFPEFGAFIVRKPSAAPAVATASR
jgi:hypothetical protein